jgi:hypothetical protein
MKRREELLKICTAQTDKKEYAEKYADHLEELFDLVEPSKINESYAKAIENEDFASAVNILATYYRNKPDFGAGLSAKGSYSIEGAENTVNGVMREVSVDWTFPNGEIDFLFDPTEVIPHETTNGFGSSTDTTTGQTLQEHTLEQATKYTQKRFRTSFSAG